MSIDANTSILELAALVNQAHIDRLFTLSGKLR
jgi:hypothetical protein